MTSRFDGAEILAAVWRLGAGDERLPTSHGILDKALKDCFDDLPDQLKGGLSFGVTGVGLRCYELPDILLAAQEALLTTEPNPTYLSTMVTLDEGSARQLVLSHGIRPEKARTVGRRLREVVKATASGHSESDEAQYAAA
ncbi:hypothetical protein [Enterovirga aerilata]|uniref:Uncharacterized protein n=1 Tax=Enterovirga aerilata TaxID=2730920 RepID=A0A849IDZ2_9HYPH|nr:hypothetical protein [Enterovirga sp. DB1703]NNM74197.1 hypothetical protein [Enterovirga sp. DB1703]